MNNHWHLYKHLKNTKIRALLGDQWLREHQDYIEYYSKMFIRESWGKLPLHLSRENYRPLVEQDSSASKYPKFTGQSLEKMLTSLFVPIPVRHDTFKVRQNSNKFSNGVEDQYSSPTPTLASA
ncbi:Cullin repeat-like-containing domain-containing protein [Artemisia annua]|uniref:Cullin repeat-like-containing domain-containing protein n=1 Tax=Artemisia annua TaxID=35608 RepID=A0A2U1NU24_ARTAN|nr:Cullin repeat-like-containing domain-containing protein [Artemisia annua]